MIVSWKDMLRHLFPLVLCGACFWARTCSATFCDGLLPGKYCDANDTLNIISCPGNIRMSCPAGRFCDPVGRVPDNFKCVGPVTQGICGSVSSGSVCVPVGDSSGYNGYINCANGKLTPCSFGQACVQAGNNLAVCSQVSTSTGTTSEMSSTMMSSSSSTSTSTILTSIFTPVTSFVTSLQITSQLPNFCAGSSSTYVPFCGVIQTCSDFVTPTSILSTSFTLTSSESCIVNEGGKCVAYPSGCLVGQIGTCISGSPSTQVTVVSHLHEPLICSGYQLNTYNYFTCTSFSTSFEMTTITLTQSPGVPSCLNTQNQYGPNCFQLPPSCVLADYAGCVLTGTIPTSVLALGFSCVSETTTDDGSSCISQVSTVTTTVVTLQSSGTCLVNQYTKCVSYESGCTLNQFGQCFSPAQLLITPIVVSMTGSSWCSSSVSTTDMFGDPATSCVDMTIVTTQTTLSLTDMGYCQGFQNDWCQQIATPSPPCVLNQDLGCVLGDTIVSTVSVAVDEACLSSTSVIDGVSSCQFYTTALVQEVLTLVASGACLTRVGYNPACVQIGTVCSLYGYCNDQ